MTSKIPYDVPQDVGRGLPYDLAVERGICGAQRKNEEAPCQGPRDESGRSVCGRHCGSKNRQGYPCSQHPQPNGRCRSHGGESPVGAGSGRFKDGTHSKYRTIFSGEALEHYESVLRDERYLELREDMALLDTLLLEELMRAKVGEGAALWAELGEVWAKFRAAETSNDTNSPAGGCLRRMGEIISEGVGRHAAQDRALDIVERKRKVSETERKRIVDEQQTITQAKAMAFAGAMIALMREAVAGEENEREILARFHSGVARLIHQDVSGGAGSLPAA